MRERLLLNVCWVAQNDRKKSDFNTEMIGTTCLSNLNILQSFTRDLEEQMQLDGEFNYKCIINIDHPD